MSVEDRIRAAVDEAIRTDSVLDVPKTAAAIAAGDTADGASKSDIAKMLMEAGIAAGIAMKIPGGD